MSEYTFRSFRNGYAVRPEFALSDFGDQEEFLELSKKLYRHIYYAYPEMVGKYAALFRAMFMNNAASGEENADT